MENRIISGLDKLTVEQTERLLGENMEMKISGKDRSRIKNAVFEKIGAAKKKRLYMPKRLAACAAALAIVLTSLSVMGFNNVAAAIRNWLTFIPGVGIEVKSDATIYSIDPIVRRTTHQNATAGIVSAVYANGYLNVTVEVNDRANPRDGEMPFYDDFSLYVNGQSRNYREQQSSANLFWSSNSVMLHFSYETDTPASDDIYEIAVTGFTERLSFRMMLCLDYEDIKQIGPTDIQNGISVTATALSAGNELLVWCYPFRVANHTKDMILGYGRPAAGSFVTERYIQTESGKIFENRSGWNISERLIFEMPENDQTATLHIPYLSMRREEKRVLNINLPNDYTTAESDAAVQTGLGTIKVTEVKREPNEYESGRDTVRIYFEFDSKDENMRLYSFDNDVFDHDVIGSVRHFNAQTGCLEYLEAYAGKDDKKVSINISSLYYYLFGEYVIPLDIMK